MGTLFWDIWPFLLALIQFGGMAGAAIHVMLTKTDERAAAGWRRLRRRADSGALSQRPRRVRTVARCRGTPAFCPCCD